MEAFQLGIAADAGDGDRLEDLPRHAVGVDRRGDHAGPGGNGPQLLRKLCFTENEAVDIRFQGPADDLRLVAADGNAVLPGKEMLVRALRQGQNDLAGDRVHILAGIVENLALNGSQQIKQRHVPDEGVGDRLHIVVRHVPGREHPVERAVRVGDRNGGDPGVPAQDGPGAGNGHAGVQNGRRVEVEVPDLGADVLDQHRRLKAEAVEDPLGFVVEIAQAAGRVAALAQGVLQGGIGHC